MRAFEDDGRSRLDRSSVTGSRLPVPPRLAEIVSPLIRATLDLVKESPGIDLEEGQEGRRAARIRSGTFRGRWSNETANTTRSGPTRLVAPRVRPRAPIRGCETCGRQNGSSLEALQRSAADPFGSMPRRAHVEGRGPVGICSPVAQDELLDHVAGGLVPELHRGGDFMK